jgi:hypothetical protein
MISSTCFLRSAKKTVNKKYATILKEYCFVLYNKLLLFKINNKN